MMAWLWRICLLVGVLVAVSAAEEEYALSDEFIDSINRNARTWIAGRNFDSSYSMDFIKGLMGVKQSDRTYYGEIGETEFPLSHSLPKNFDSRRAWPHCQSLKAISDQGACGSCWAVSAVDVMTDRACISSKAKRKFEYSAEDLMSCCDSCGMGCDGGFPMEAFNYWVDTGIVSGGPYHSKIGCLPYEVAPCEHHTKGNRPNCTAIKPTPACQRTCEKSYHKSFSKDLHKGERAYPVPSTVSAIQMELFNNGPVSAAFSVYEDFLSYKSGVYKHVTGEFLGGHAVRVLGWGVEQGVDYWLVANSWNTDWGDKGHFKILRGVDECGFESAMVAGIPAEHKEEEYDEY